MATTSNNDSDNIETLEDILSSFEEVKRVQSNKYKIESEYKTITSVEIGNILNAGFDVNEVRFEEKTILVEKVEEESEPEQEKATIVDKLEAVVEDCEHIEEIYGDRDREIMIRISEEKSILLSAVEIMEIKDLGWEIAFIGNTSGNTTTTNVYLKERTEN